MARTPVGSKSSRQGEFELESANHSSRSGGIMGISLRFSLKHEGMLCVLIRIASSRRF